VANWGTHRVLLRLPPDLLDLDAVAEYCVGEQVSTWSTDEFILLDFTSEDETGEYDVDPDAAASLSAIAGVRAELAAGDLRPLYVAWLAAYGVWERDEDAFDRDADHDLEPPVPPGLATLTAPQRALADFLRLDEDLVADDPGDLAAWVTRMAATEKDRLLGRVIQGDARVRMELLRRFRGDIVPTVPSPARRTVADLLDTTADRRADRERRQAAQRADDEARRARACALARERRLDELARDEDAAWSRVDALIAARKPAEYDAAVTLLTDLQALAERDNRHHSFTARTAALRETHARKPSLIQRLNHARI
jgi:hypothetical protein